MSTSLTVLVTELTDAFSLLVQCFPVAFYESVAYEIVVSPLALFPDVPVSEHVRSYFFSGGWMLS